MRTTKRIKGAFVTQRGFTLIELMIGLLLGLLTVLVITQVMVTAEGKRRSVTMGSDAQTNGAMALYTLQRDIQMAGYGMTSSMDALGCTVKAQHNAFSSFSFMLAPVVITDGAGGAPDSIRVLRGRASNFSVPLPLSEVHLQTDNQFTVRSSFGTAPGNIMIAVPKLQGPGSWCSLFNATHDPAATVTTLTPTQVPHVAGLGGEWNQNSLMPASYAKDDYLLRMESLVLRDYSINVVNKANNLQVSELSTATGNTASQDLYPQIVNLQAMYGKGALDASGNVVMNSYDNATPMSNAEWQQVAAIRIAVVVRSNQYEKDRVTQSPPQWDIGLATPVNGSTVTACGTSKCIALKIDHLADWEHYRYKVYETIVPLRNILWNS